MGIGVRGISKNHGLRAVDFFNKSNNKWAIPTLFIKISVYNLFRMWGVCVACPTKVSIAVISTKVTMPNPHNIFAPNLTFSNILFLPTTEFWILVILRSLWQMSSLWCRLYIGYNCNICTYHKIC